MISDGTEKKKKRRKKNRTSLLGYQGVWRGEKKMPWGEVGG